MGLLDRLRDLAKKPKTPGLTPETAGLEIVVQAFDPALADSAVLAASPTWVSAAPAVLRHHLRLPPALHCAQERSRMAGLAQRLGGDALGWDALQPESPA
jgi:hypothetical protein